jgi:CRISPR-associated protein (TIGR02584 family)
VVTETLYALLHQEPRFVPTEVALVTTGEATERVRLQLLGSDPGWFRRLCSQCEVDGIRFDESSLHVLNDATGTPLTDIRDHADNERAADLITEVVRELSADSDCAIHASIAGGRKTMGFYLGYAMSLFGRGQDRLSHVLVPTGYEGNPLFFYPTRERHVIYDRNNRPMDAREATVTLANIPFVRLRDGLDEALRFGRAGYSETVERAQRDLGPPGLALDAATRTVRCGNTKVSLTPTNFAFYAWFARRAQQGRDPLHWTTANGEELLAEYAQTVGPHSGSYEALELALTVDGQRAISKEYWEQRLARIKKALQAALGKRGAELYGIRRVGNEPGTKYGLYAIDIDSKGIKFQAKPGAVGVGTPVSAGPVVRPAMHTGKDEAEATSQACETDLLNQPGKESDC